MNELSIDSIGNFSTQVRVAGSMSDREYVFQVFTDSTDYSEDTPYANFYVELEDALDYPIYLYDPEEAVWWFGGGPREGTREEPTDTLESYLTAVAEYPPLTRYIYNLSPSEEESDESLSLSDFDTEALPPHEEKFFLDILSQLEDGHVPAEMRLYLRRLYERDNQPPDEAE